MSNGRPPRGPGRRRRYEAISMDRPHSNEGNEGNEGNERAVQGARIDALLEKFNEYIAGTSTGFPYLFRDSEFEDNHVRWLYRAGLCSLSVLKEFMEIDTCTDLTFMLGLGNIILEKIHSIKDNIGLGFAHAMYGAYSALWVANATGTPVKDNMYKINCLKTLADVQEFAYCLYQYCDETGAKVDDGMEINTQHWQGTSAIDYILEHFHMKKY